VAPLPFNMALMEFLAAHRTAFLTHLFLAATFLGDTGGYILIVTLIYVAWNKRLAVRLSVLVLLASSLNVVLKLIVKNPRPFVREGTYLEKWAVSPRAARGLAAQYSTPSGHAMGAAAFYPYLYKSVKKSYIRVIAVTAVVLIGISRPYLGVHYAEDVLIGWAIGLGIALVAIRYAPAIDTLWDRLSYGQQVGVAVFGGLAIWLLAIALNGGRLDGQPREALCNAGFLAGIILARPLELRRVNFDPHSLDVVAKVLRFLLSAALMAGTLLTFGWASAAIPSEFLLLANLLEYLRFAAAGFVVIFVAPLLFTTMGLAERTAAEAN
jgi:membrane-associated phospholipid phosphatase